MKRNGDRTYVILPSGRVGRWTETTSDGHAVVVSGYDTFVVDPSLLNPAFDF